MTSYRNPPKKVAKIRIAGPDKKGIIAHSTGYLFQNQCNIEDIDQRLWENYLIMNMVVDYTDLKTPLPTFLEGLHKMAGKLGMEVDFKPQEKKTVKNVAILVTKEAHCLVDLLENFKKKKLQGRASLVIGNHPDLEKTALKYKVPFYSIPSDKKKDHEARLIELLVAHEIDLVVLARYMQILSPEFNFRYEGRIINIHPSLLPAFPGPRSYHQAFNKGVEIVGVTAHFVTTNLDEGPIIAQESFAVDKTSDTIESIIERGQKLEAKALTRAVKLFLEDRLCLRRGKVIDNKKLKSQAEKAACFYQ